MKIFGRIYCVLILLMPWAISTQFSQAQLYGLATLFKTFPGSQQLFAVGSPRALEECIDYAIVLLSLVPIAGFAVASALTPSSIEQARVRRRQPISFRQRLACVGLACLVAYAWINPTIPGDYSGAAVGVVSRLIDTNVLARGIYFAGLLITAAFSAAALAVAFDPRRASPRHA